LRLTGLIRRKVTRRDHDRLDGGATPDDVLVVKLVLKVLHSLVQLEILPKAEIFHVLLLDHLLAFFGDLLELLDERRLTGNRHVGKVPIALLLRQILLMLPLRAVERLLEALVELVRVPTPCEQRKEEHKREHATDVSEGHPEGRRSRSHLKHRAAEEDLDAWRLVYIVAVD